MATQSSGYGAHTILYAEANPRAAPGKSAAANVRTSVNIAES
jgi:hypothetical protein